MKTIALAVSSVLILCVCTFAQTDENGPKAVLIAEFPTNITSETAVVANYPAAVEIIVGKQRAGASNPSLPEIVVKVFPTIVAFIKVKCEKSNVNTISGREGLLAPASSILNLNFYLLQ